MAYTALPKNKKPLLIPPNVKKIKLKFFREIKTDKNNKDRETNHQN